MLQFMRITWSDRCSFPNIILYTGVGQHNGEWGQGEGVKVNKDVPFKY